MKGERAQPALPFLPFFTGDFSNMKALSWLLAGLTAVALHSNALAQNAGGSKPAESVPVEDFIRRAQFTSYFTSPDGTKLAALVPVNGRDNLVVIDLDKRTRTNITNFDKYDVGEVAWITNKRLWFRTIEARDIGARARYQGSYAINVDGSEIRQTDMLRGTPTGASLVRVVNRETGDLIIAANLRSRTSVDLYLINTSSNKLDLLTFDRPANTTSYLLDDKNVARFAWAATDPKKSRDQELWYRDNAEAKWERLQVWQEGGEFWEPLAFESGGKRVIVASNVGRDKRALYWWDVKTRKLGDLILEHPLVDLAEEADFANGGANPLIMLADPNKPDDPAVPVGARFQADVPVIKWFDPELQQLQEMLDAALPGRVNYMPALAKLGRRVIVRSASLDEPVRHYFFDPAKKTIEELPPSRPALAGVAMPERRYAGYTARDGLGIPAWLTLPKGAAGKKLPLIVHIHGGPYLRDYGPLAARPEGQLFASRGYAVLEPEPRGSKGFGRKHFKGGWGTWGQEMQNDITDGVKALVAKGLVDPNRVCLYGGSYGGYATLQGLVREPEMFRCGLSFVAVTDLVLFQETTWSDIPVEFDSMQQWFAERVGDPKKDEAKLAANSPLRNAAKIKAPVLLVMGEDDVRVPQVHGDRMRDALKAAGVPLEYHVYVGEGHGWQKEENRIDFYKRALAFFDKHLKK
jgi:dipeptidyl aminopeptidase/acylaminoacyl peptidase